MFVFSSKIQSHRCTLESSSTRKNKWEQHWLKNNEICLFIIFVRVRDVVEKIQKYLMIFGARRFEFRLKSDQWTSIFLQRFPRLLRQHRWPEKEKKIVKTGLVVCHFNLTNNFLVKILWILSNEIKKIKTNIAI